MSQSDSLELKNPAFAAVLAWLVPGLGHLYQGRFAKGVLFLVCILGLFVFGYALGDWQVVYFRWNDREWRWPYLAQVGAGVVSLPALVRTPLIRSRLPEPAAGFQMPPNEQQLDALQRKLGTRVEVALVYTMIAGLLNILAVYDALAGPAHYEEECKMRARDEENDQDESDDAEDMK